MDVSSVAVLCDTRLIGPLSRSTEAPAVPGQTDAVQHGPMDHLRPPGAHLLFTRLLLAGEKAYSNREFLQ